MVGAIARAQLQAHIANVVLARDALGGLVANAVALEADLVLVARPAHSAASLVDAADPTKTPRYRGRGGGAGRRLVRVMAVDAGHVARHQRGVFSRLVDPVAAVDAMRAELGELPIEIMLGHAAVVAGETHVGLPIPAQEARRVCG